MPAHEAVPDPADDGSLIAQWVDEHADALYRFAMRRVGDQHTVEDLLQETYLAALRAKESYRGDASVRTWLIAILRLKIIDFYRRKSRLRESQRMQIEPIEASLVREERLEAWNCDPDRTLESQEFWEVFHACVGKLPDTLGRAFRLREFDGCPAATVCEILQITQENLAVRIFRARSALRDCLDKNWFSKD